MDITSAIISIILWTIIGGIFIYIGAKLAKISDATFLKAFEAAFIGAILSLILTYISPVYGGIIAWILVIPIIKYVYNTTWVKAFIAWIIYFIVLIIVSILVVGAYLAL